MCSPEHCCAPLRLVGRSSWKPGSPGSALSFSEAPLGSSSQQCTQPQPADSTRGETRRLPKADSASLSWVAHSGASTNQHLAQWP